MKKFYVLLILFMSHVVAFASDGDDGIIIRPNFIAGDTLRYKFECSISPNGNSPENKLIEHSKLLTLIVEAKNERGYIFSLKSKVESLSSDYAMPEQEMDHYRALSNDMNEKINLRFSTDLSGKVDSVLNFPEIKSIYRDFIISESKHDDVNESGDVDISKMVDSYIDMTITPQHVFDESFGNVNFFKVYGIPLNNGKYPFESFSGDYKGFLDSVDFDVIINKTGSLDEINIQNHEDECNIDICYVFDDGKLLRGYQHITCSTIDLNVKYSLELIK